MKSSFAPLSLFTVLFCFLLVMAWSQNAPPAPAPAPPKVPKYDAESVKKWRNEQAITPYIEVEATAGEAASFVIVSRPPMFPGARGVMLCAYASDSPATSFAGKPTHYLIEAGHFRGLGRTHWGPLHTAAIWTLDVWDGMGGQSGGGEGVELPSGKYTLSVVSSAKKDKGAVLASLSGPFDKGGVVIVQTPNPPAVIPARK